MCMFMCVCVCVDRSISLAFLFTHIDRSLLLSFPFRKKNNVCSSMCGFYLRSNIAHCSTKPYSVSMITRYLYTISFVLPFSVKFLILSISWSIPSRFTFFTYYSNVISCCCCYCSHRCPHYSMKFSVFPFRFAFGLRKKYFIYVI